MKAAVLALLRASSDLRDVNAFKDYEVTLNLQKKGGAKVKCGNAKTFLPGPTADQVVAQLGEWLPTPLADRRAGQAARDQRNAAIAAAIIVGAAATAIAVNGGGGDAAGAGADALAGTAGKLLLFGGEDHKTFLGCLTCSEFSADSVKNTYGSFGSSYSTTSVINPYSPFGSPYGQFSACNPYASDPPVIVDPDGKYYGRLSVSATKAVPAAWRAWIEGVCAR